MLRTTRESLQGRRVRTRVLREVARLDGASDPYSQRLALGLGSAAQRPPDEVARAWAARIEAERARLLGSDVRVSGSGGSHASLATVTRQASLPPHQGALLFALARRTGATSVLEMGTCVGISGAYLAAAMAAGGGGVLRSLEGHADRAEIARDTWHRLGLTDTEVVVGRFSRTLGRALQGGPYDLVFVDGHHDGAATIGYVAEVRRASPPGTVLVLDDIDWSSDMREAWTTLRAGLVTSATCDLGRFGVVVLGAGDGHR